jgi:hypothetical protein
MNSSVMARPRTEVDLLRAEVDRLYAEVDRLRTENDRLCAELEGGASRPRGRARYDT